MTKEKNTSKEKDWRFQDFFVNNRDGLAMIDVSGRFLDANPAYCEMLGYTLDELKQMDNFYQITPERWRQWEQKEIIEKRLSKDGYSGVYEKEYIHKDGHVFPVELQSHTFFDEQGKPHYFWGIARDITERKQAENELKKAHEELEQRVEARTVDLKTVNKKLKQEIKERTQAEKALQQNEKFLTAVFDAIQDGVSVLDRDLNIVRVNQTMKNLYAHKLPLEGKKCFDAYHRRSEHCETCPTIRAFKTGKLEMNEVPLTSDKGVVGALELFAFPMLDNTKKPITVVEYVRDITDRKLVENALKESETRHRVLISEMLNGFALHEILVDDHNKPFDYRFLEVNSAFERLTGLKMEEIIGKTVLEVLPNTEPYWIETYGEIALSGKSLQFQNYSKAFKKHFEVLAYSPQKGQFATVFTDITDRLQAEEALRESEERYKNIFETISDSLFVTDMEGGEILEVNPAACRTYGYTEKELKGRLALDLISPESRHVFYSFIQSLNETGQFHGETVDIRRDGARINTEVTGTVIHYMGQKRLVASIRDVTRRKKMEKEREKLIKKLESTLAEIKTLRGILPLCSFCKKIRNDKGYWEKVDVYIKKYSDADISHGICPECIKKHYPGEYESSL